VPPASAPLPPPAFPASPPPAPFVAGPPPGAPDAPAAPHAPAAPAALVAPVAPVASTPAEDTLTLDACPIVLQRNQRVSLTSSASGPLGRMVVNLGWVPGAGRLDIDLDASAIAFDASGNKLEIVWYQHQNEFFGSLYHTGDNKTGSAEGDGERILVDLARMPGQVEALVFTISSFHGQTFTDLERAQCTITDEYGQLLVQYDLTDTQPSTAVLVAIVRRTPSGAWLLRTIGEYHDYRTVKKLVDPAARQVSLG
jgi:stress response protein SCP2